MRDISGIRKLTNANLEVLHWTDKGQQRQKQENVGFVRRFEAEADIVCLFDGRKLEIFAGISGFGEIGDKMEFCLFQERFVMKFAKLFLHFA